MVRSGALSDVVAVVYHYGTVPQESKPAMDSKTMYPPMFTPPYLGMIYYLVCNIMYYYVPPQ